MCVVYSSPCGNQLIRFSYATNVCEGMCVCVYVCVYVCEYICLHNIISTKLCHINLLLAIRSAYLYESLELFS